jgi:hypothetical protein
MGRQHGHHTYDTAGRVSTLNDGKGLYTYSYDGTDAASRAERRGLRDTLAKINRRASAH